MKKKAKNTYANLKCDNHHHHPVCMCVCFIYVCSRCTLQSTHGSSFGRSSLQNFIFIVFHLLYTIRLSCCYRLFTIVNIVMDKLSSLHIQNLNARKSHFVSNLRIFGLCISFDSTKLLSNTISTEFQRTKHSLIVRGDTKISIFLAGFELLYIQKCQINPLRLKTVENHDIQH